MTDVDPSEWDAIITTRHLAKTVESNFMAEARYVRPVSAHLCVLLVMTPEEFGGGWSDIIDVLDVPGASDIHVPLAYKWNVAGHHAYPGDTGLSESLTVLVKQQLIPAVASRTRQFGVGVTDEEIEPLVDFGTFLRGPNQLRIAGKYVHPGNGSVWFIPHDVENIEPWWLLALSDWHDRFPNRFPDVPKWEKSADWMTHAERVVQAKLDAEYARFKPLQEEHDAITAELGTELEAAKDNASRNERVLLTGQDEELQDAVLRALVTLGYTVQDMDKLWPDKERREDYRITEPGVDDWLVLADATGVTKGAKQSKLQILNSNVVKYVFEEKPQNIPRQWLIVNRLIARDPTTRGDVFRPDELGPLSENQGLAFDTAALFVLQDAVVSGKVTAVLVREMLRERTGQLRLEDAREWLNRQEP
ncbi:MULTISPECIES: hypothetical protein [unclassified Rhodococcus (in: high G+C Gram-positive bacteria)]|uniref:hypothetical protein n=1 Tax=unclassified Rhodococcus (in: high G+C Gram-positive bacteria) TaxID=192944 RepID=UPI00163A6BA4|nr:MULTISPECIES: hypothetical protein [unclassified Rhodococcus (in: high G+C Gram-positive bacteria)]MBC2639659.1 hypothetical protein [Rhodococcus sp. 3A]MBC2895596.1 hypothetical protein [Rhodococcus sp. 4CII]